jgi:hypothetical protein
MPLFAFLRDQTSQFLTLAEHASDGELLPICYPGAESERRIVKKCLILLVELTRIERATS